MYFALPETSFPDRHQTVRVIVFTHYIDIAIDLKLR